MILYVYCSVVSVLPCIQCFSRTATCMSLYVYLLYLYYYMHVDLILHVFATYGLIMLLSKMLFIYIPAVATSTTSLAYRTCL